MTIFCIKKNIWCRFTLSILMFTAVFCSLQPEPEKEDPIIEVYMTRYNESVELYAAIVSHIYGMFYYETGLSKTMFDLLSSKGQLPTLTKEPYQGIRLQEDYRQAKWAFYTRCCTIMAEFLRDNGLLGLFTLDDRYELGGDILHLLYEGEIFFEVRTDEDFRDALLLVLASQKGARSIFCKRVQK